MKKDQDILKKMFDTLEPEKAPESFKKNLMDKIVSETSHAAHEESEYIISIRFWLLVAAVVSVAVVVVIFVDTAFLGRFLDEVDLMKFTAFFQSIYTGLRDIFAGISITSITVYIIGSAFGLLLLDRILRKTFQINILAF